MSSRSYRRGRSRRAVRKQSLVPFFVVAVVLLLLGVGAAAFLRGAGQAAASTKYQLEEVVHDRPIVAVHEMGEGPAIPFLSPKDPQPDIDVPEKSHDFGTIGPRDIVQREFIIRNVGDAPLTISRAYTTCGCTTAEISASAIPPGKVATISLIFDAGFHDTAGQTVRRGLIIENNDPNQSQVEIWVQASVGLR